MAKTKNKGGRPQKLSEELIEEICETIRLGAYVETAVVKCGIGKNTFYTWLKKAKQVEETARKSGKNPPANNLFIMFRDALDIAMAESEVRALSIIQDSAKKGDWRAAEWFLSRRFAKKWSPKVEFSESDRFDDNDSVENIYEKLLNIVAPDDEQSDP